MDCPTLACGQFCVSHDVRFDVAISTYFGFQACHAKKALNVCIPGYTYRSCRAFVCSCPNGIPAQPGFCQKHGEVFCETCLPGYYKNGKVCTKKEGKLHGCKCTNGTPTPFLRCGREKQEDCDKCNAGFHVKAASHNQRICIPNVCLCPGPHVPALGKACKIHASWKCVKCAKGKVRVGVRTQFSVELMIRTHRQLFSWERNWSSPSLITTSRYCSQHANTTSHLHV